MSNVRSDYISAIMAMWGEYRQSLLKAYEPLIATYDVSLPHVKILIELAKHDRAVPVRDLVKRYHITAGAITQLVDKLVHLGLVERHENATDRRVSEISIAPSAQSTVGDIITAHRAALKQHFSVLSDNELETLATCFRKLTSSNS